MKTLITVLLSAASLTILFGSPNPQTAVPDRTLTFAERVSYQRAIEEVYWRHRIWPKERLDRKPSLDAVISQGHLERKVADYLHNSQTLEHYWQQPITAQQLQTEMDRMAKGTSQPEILLELFEALSNDPVAIAECLARPALVDRLLQLVQVSQEAHVEAKRLIDSNDARLKPFTGYTLPVIATTSPLGGTCTGDSWTATSVGSAPIGRVGHTAVWTGTEMIVWGGWDSQGNYFSSGGRYTPSTDSWSGITATNAPSARYGHTAVWTGTEMVIWGGEFYDGNGHRLDTGGRYNPSTNNWTATSTANVPTGRYNHTTVWTGTEMITWGGIGENGIINTGGRYNPTTDNWAAISMTNAPTARSAYTAVWTGTEMIIWGGFAVNGQVNTGGRYNPSTDSWTATSTSGVPVARGYHTVVWTGTEMIIWGGWGNAGLVNTGGLYNPGADSWSATNISNAPDTRSRHTATWTGNEMIVWGGYNDFLGDLNTGGRYDLATDSWTDTNTTDAPTARQDPTAIWTGSEMIVWGGIQNNPVTDTGGRYCAFSGTPSPTPTPRHMPSPRPRPTPEPRP